MVLSTMHAFPHRPVVLMSPSTFGATAAFGMGHAIPGSRAGAWALGTMPGGGSVTSFANHSTTVRATGHHVEQVGQYGAQTGQGPQDNVQDLTPDGAVSRANERGGEARSYESMA